MSRIWGKAATLDAPQQVGIDSKQHPLLFSDGVPGIMTDSHEASQDGPEQGCDWSGAADNELLAAILHGAAEAVIAIDQAQNISLFNEGAERIFGYRAEEVIGEPLSLLLPQRFRRGHKTAIREFGQNPVGARLMGQRGEIAGLRKDGTEFPAEASIIHLPHGQRYGFAAILRDVSERHEAAQALRKSEETHRQLADLLGTVLDALPANIAVLDESGKIIRVNESWARFVLQNGYRQPDLGVGRDYQEVCEAATGISAEGAREVGQKLQQVLNGQSLGFTTDYPCHAPAAKRWFQVLAAPTMGAAGTGAVVMHIDITERKQATAALATERHLLELVASDQPLSEILEELCQTVEQQAPSSICTVLGADSFSRRLKFFAGRNFPEAFRERISGLLVGEAPYPCAEALRTGREVWLADAAEEGPWPEFRKMMLSVGLRSSWSVPIAAFSGQPVAVFAIYRSTPGIVDDNLTRTVQRTTHIAGIAIEQRSAQQALRESEERYALAFQGANDGLWDWDLRTNRVYRSPRCLEIIGRLPDVAERTRIASRDWLVSLVHPADLPHSEAALARHLDGKTPFFEAEYRIRLPGGGYRWVFDRGLALRDAEGRPYRMAGSMTDVTLRKQAEEAVRLSEERLRQIARNVPGAIFEQLRRSDGTIVYPYMSEGIYRIMGGAIDLAELATRPDSGFELVHPEDRERLRGAIEASARELQPLKTEWRTTDRGGGFRWVESIAESRLLPGGDVIWEGVLIDVTERRLADEQRQLLEDQLRQAQKADALGTLAGGIAHDINNTLVPVIGLTELALDLVREAGPLRENLEQILAGGQRIRDLVKQILAFSRQDKPERKPVDLRTVAAETAGLLRATIPTTISFHVDWGDELLLVHADITQLHQVIMNLVSNAVSAIGPKSGAIELRLGRELVMPNGRPYGKLSVVDSGDGIPPGVIDRIFDPFFTTKPVGEGTGLGLSVVQGIVKSHGGLISVRSRPGQGARFDVLLPLIDRETDNAERD